MSNTVRSLGWSSDAMKPDYSSTTRVTIWVLLGITLSIFIARQIVKAVIFNKLGLDDVFMLIASVGSNLEVYMLLLTAYRFQQPAWL